MIRKEKKTPFQDSRLANGKLLRGLLVGRYRDSLNGTTSNYHARETYPGTRYIQTRAGTEYCTMHRVNGLWLCTANDTVHLNFQLSFTSGAKSPGKQAEFCGIFASCDPRKVDSFFVLLARSHIVVSSV